MARRKATQDAFSLMRATDAVDDMMEINSDYKTRFVVDDDGNSRGYVEKLRWLCEKHEFLLYLAKDRINFLGYFSISTRVEGVGVYVPIVVQIDGREWCISACSQDSGYYACVNGLKRKMSEECKRAIDGFIENANRAMGKRLVFGVDDDLNERAVELLSHLIHEMTDFEPTIAD